MEKRVFRELLARGKVCLISKCALVSEDAFHPHSLAAIPGFIAKVLPLILTTYCLLFIWFQPVQLPLWSGFPSFRSERLVEDVSSRGTIHTYPSFLFFFFSFLWFRSSMGNSCPMLRPAMPMMTSALAAPQTVTFSKLSLFVSTFCNNFPRLCLLCG
jgi:hypothetical protein